MTAQSLPKHLQCSPFPLATYERFLDEARKADYRILRFEDVLSTELSPNGKYLLLRHDIDLAPTMALKMARLESDLGVKSSYLLHAVGGILQPRRAGES